MPESIRMRASRTWLGYDRLMVVHEAQAIIERYESEQRCIGHIREARAKGDNKAARTWIGYLRNARYGLETHASALTREARIAQQFVDCRNARFASMNPQTTEATPAATEMTSTTETGE